MNILTAMLISVLLTAACGRGDSTDDILLRTDEDAGNDALGAPLITADPDDGRRRAGGFANYVATMADMERFADATRNLKQVAREHPELEAATVFNLSELDQTESRLRSDPRLVNAIEDAGLSPAKYAMLSSLTVLIGLASLAPPDKAEAMIREANIHPDNVEFFRKNGERIRELNAAAQQ